MCQHSNSGAWGVPDRFRSAFSSVYRSVHGELARFFGKRLDSPADAADLTQDAFSQWLRWRERGSVEQPRAFLFHIARNLLRDHWRRQQVRGHSESLEESAVTLEDPSADPLERLEQQQRLQRLARALDDLPPRRREALILHKFDGLSQAEVARRMGISISMVEKHIAAALLHCRRQAADEPPKDE